MGDQFPSFKIAAVQAAPVFLDREATTEKACQLIREAAAKGARIVGFPEGFIPAHPIWFHFHPSTDKISTQLSVALFKNSVEIPGPQIAQLCQVAKETKTYVVMGVCERNTGTMGTMYNTQVFIGADGSVLGKHQKIMPTTGERLVHTGGYGDTLRTFPTEFGPISGLICGENTNPLAIFALVAEFTRIHIASWPSNFTLISHPMRERMSFTAKAFAEMSKAYVISCCALADERTIKMLQLTNDQEKYFHIPENTGGSLIVAPDAEIIAGPLGNEEAILYADVDLNLIIKRKLRQDFAGHYNRPDIFQLKINRTVPSIYNQEEQSDDHKDFQNSLKVNQQFTDDSNDIEPGFH